MYWSADGKWLAYADFGDRGISVATVSALMTVDIEGDHTPRVLIKGSAGRIAPTERWVAVTSATTGTDEIYVLPFPDTSRGRSAHFHRRRPEPDVGARRQDAVLSSRAGDDGREPLAVTIPRPGRSRRCCSRARICSTSGRRTIDAARDGRLLMVKTVARDGDGALRQLVVVQNWFEELRRLAPSK